MGLTNKLGLLAQSVQQDTSLNIGIGGAANASYKLQVTGTTNLTGALSGTSATFSGSVTSDDVIFTAGTLFGTGNTGFSNRASDTTLYLQMPATGFNITDNALNTRFILSSTGAATFTSNSNSTITNTFENTNTTNTNSRNYFNITAGNVTTSIQAIHNDHSYINVTNNLYFQSGGGVKMTMLSSGNVGIGLTTGTGKVYIKQTSAFLYEGLNVYASSNDAFVGIGHTGSLAVINSSYNSTAAYYPLAFYTSDTERMRITSGGNVGIGSAGDSGYRLIVRGSDNSSSNWAILLQNAAENVLFRVRNDGAFFTNIFTYNNTVTSGVRTVYMDSGYALGGLSSIRASKKNIENISNVDWVYQLNPVTFNYRKKDEDGKYTEEFYDELIYGLIAEDTASIADFLINYNDKEDGTKEMVGIEYSRLITPLLKAIQELNAKVSALENKS